MSKRSFPGFAIWALFLVGLLMLLLSKVFLKNPNSSQMDSLIQSRLTAAGLDPMTAKMWAAVARHESDTYRSEVFRTANNFFGMKWPTIRKTTAYAKTAQGYASFVSLSDSVDDLVLYLRARLYPNKFSSVSDLVTVMKSKGYFEDTLLNYLKGVEFHFKKL